MRKLVFVPILFFVSFLVVLYVVIPNYTKSNALYGQIEVREQELKEKQDYFAKIQTISNNLVQYQEFLDKIEKALPQKVSLASLLSFFQDRAIGSGLVMENLSPIENIKQKFSKGEEEEEKVKETGFRLTVSGSFSSFENFLRTIEKSSRLIEVASVVFDEGESSSGVESNEGEEPVLPVLSGAEGSEAEGVMNFEFDVALKVYSY